MCSIWWRVCCICHMHGSRLLLTSVIWWLGDDALSSQVKIQSLFFFKFYFMDTQSFFRTLDCSFQQVIVVQLPQATTVVMVMALQFHLYDTELHPPPQNKAEFNTVKRKSWKSWSWGILTKAHQIHFISYVLIIATYLVKTQRFFVFTMIGNRNVKVTKTFDYLVYLHLILILNLNLENNLPSGNIGII